MNHLQQEMEKAFLDDGVSDESCSDASISSDSDSTSSLQYSDSLEYKAGKENEGASDTGMRTDSNHDNVSQLMNLTSPEKCKSLLELLLRNHSFLWQNIHSVVCAPNNAISGSNSLAICKPSISNNGNNDSNNDINNGIRSSSCIDPIDSVIYSLSLLQLKELPYDLLGIVVAHLTVFDNTALMLTASFFLENVSKLIQNVYISQHVHQCNGAAYGYLPDNRLFDHCERLRYLQIDSPNYFDFPFQCIKTLHEVSFANVHFTNFLKNREMAQISTNNSDNQDDDSKESQVPDDNCNNRQMVEFLREQLSKPQKLGNSITVSPSVQAQFSLQYLALSKCENLNVQAWLFVTDKKHSPHLRSVELNLQRDIDYWIDDRENENYNLLKFGQLFVASENHNHIKHLTLMTNNLTVMESLCNSKNGCRVNLKKLEFRLVDRVTCDDSATNIGPLFQSVYSNKPFPKLSMLVIDFQPNQYIQTPGIHITDQIFATDFDRFSSNMGQIFPRLQLLAMYGSMSPLMFGDEYLEALLATKLDTLVDLSLGFELITPNGMANLLLNSENLPKLAWLTLELYNIKEKLDMFQDIISRVVKVDNYFNEKSIQFRQNMVKSDLFHDIGSSTDTESETQQGPSTNDDDNDTIVSSLDDDISHLKMIENKMENLEWVTLCVCDKEDIIDLENGINVELWDRGIDECDFDEALKRSQLIVNKYYHQKKQFQQRHKQKNKNCYALDNSPCKVGANSHHKFINPPKQNHIAKQITL